MDDNYKISFEERTARGFKNLAKQKPVTLEQARAQALRLKKNSKTNIKKQRSL